MDIFGIEKIFSAPADSIELHISPLLKGNYITTPYNKRDISTEKIKKSLNFFHNN